MADVLVPESRLWRLLPVVLLVGFSLWGLVWPASQWRLLWGWQRRYRHVPQDARAAFVRKSLVVPFLIGVVLLLVLWPQRT